MNMKHLLLEVYCDCSQKEKPAYCLKVGGEIGIHCFSNQCKNLSYTYADHEIAYASDFGVVEQLNDWIGFGGDMEPENLDETKRNELICEWKNICKKKIKEAYKEYMEIKDKLSEK